MKKVLLLLVLCKLILLVASNELIERQFSCPGNCNTPYGQCNSQTGVCTCQNGYGGDDCSYAYQKLSGSTTLPSQRLSRGQWFFYLIDTNGGSLVVNVSQTVGGDVDLYMLQNQFPTKTSYSYRDITTNLNFGVIVDRAGVGTWYIGMYGALASTYTITVTISGDCVALGNCNGHGQCVSRQCVCNAGWSGADCSQSLTSLVLNGQSLSATVMRGSWNLYQLSITTSQLVTVIVNETSTDGDVDLYIKFGAIPTLISYDYRDTSVARNFGLSISDPHLGTYYLGLYGFKNTTYLIRVTTTANPCPSQCSLHGSCVSNACVCSSGFSGDACESMDRDLPFSYNQVGYVGSSAWNYYQFRPNTLYNVIIQVWQDSPSQDCDLYAKPGRRPTTTDYAVADVSTHQNFTLIISNPSDEYWYLGVFGYSPCGYVLRASFSASCPGNPVCSGHGDCLSGTCSCYSGYSGVSCNSTQVLLSNGVTISNSVFQSGWRYFSINVRNSTYLAIDLKELNITVGYLWLFASKGQVPTLRSYDYSNQQTNTRYHRLRIPFDQPQTATWQIGVYGNPFAEPNKAVAFSLAAWYTPF